MYEPKQCKSHSRSENKNVKVDSKLVEVEGGYLLRNLKSLTAPQVSVGLSKEI